MEEFSLYFAEGWKHIADLNGYDHILFVMALCAVYLLKDWKKVLILVTAFTVGHSITLALSVLNIIRVPTALIEFLIPVTIVITALVNIVRRDQPGSALQLNYLFALFFGLIHGMGFSNYLKSMLGTQTNIVQPLLAFNLGLEFGQILIVMVILLLSQIVVNLTSMARRDWIMFLSSAIFGSAFIMSIERLRELMH
ncbi:HupE/UreJ family protein [Chitinophaga barathri]|uniref:HupE/UreJ family protein n=1 Tax=Chitinophaga barathri TaxID=1647451 RepID=A0A3N4MBH4_9BACT|nr:HupE/UreJ family protein [Chitinophaga barathri]RPD40961.1 HupE/UreJ family protein [Chitinophaga barathri]